MSDNSGSPGKLYLVSIGIGDPENMTVRAQKIISSADLILGMDFVCQSVASLTHGKKVIDAGHCLFTPLTRQGKDSQDVTSQENSIRATIDEAIRKGKNVVILDFGDPMLFGPQVGYLKEFSRYNPTVIPGVSSIAAAAAFFGRPLWDNAATRVMVTTLSGFQQQKPPYPDIMIFFTMKTPLPELVAALADTCGNTMPLALVFHAGFQDRQKIIQSTVGNILTATDHLPEIPWDYLVYVGKGVAEDLEASQL